MGGKEEQDAAHHAGNQPFNAPAADMPPLHPIKQWWAFPNIGEVLQMGDAPRPVGFLPSGSEGHALAQARDDDNDPFGPPASTGSSARASGAYGQYSPVGTLGASGIEQRPLSDMQVPGSGKATGDGGDEPFSMGSVAAALPNLRHSPQAFAPGPGTQRFPSGPSPQSSQYSQQSYPFAGQAGYNPAPQNTAFPPYAPAHSPGPQGGMASSPYLLQQMGSMHRSGLGSPMQQGFPGSSMYSGQHSPSHPMMYYPQAFGGMGAPQLGLQGGPRLSPSATGFPGGFPPAAGLGAQGMAGLGAIGQQQRQGWSPGRINTAVSPGAIPSAPRGPPRKPKQSGHALWVGNLPPGALVTDLKDHFSRDATKDIESVFLISKSNCAFVNYRTEETCAAAMTRFHDSRFHGVRLVCRLRRNLSPSAPGVPTGPSALASNLPTAQTAIEAIDRNREISSRVEESLKNVEGAAKIEDKYFVVKSLTVEDLELSVRTGIWATQAHNEDALNRAFDSVKNVYLIFSANKSGEYFGYARMASRISEEIAADLDWTPATRADAALAAADPDLPRSIPTPATQTAPRGHIIDDSARGTIFWEAEHDDDEPQPSPPPTTDGVHRPTSPIAADPSLTPHQPSRPFAAADVPSPASGGPSSPQQQQAQSQPFGTPFRVQWVSTQHLPFHRTRGLRNPWNANREVKIARDGTELETSVGRRLVALFARGGVSPGASASPGSAGPGMGPSPQGYGGPSPSGMGYGGQGHPQMHRPF